LKGGLSVGERVNLIGILWIVSGVLGLFAAFLVAGLLFGLSFIPEIDPEAPGILRWIGFGIGTFLLVLAVPKIVAGIGMLKTREWARVLTLVVSFLSILEFPLGTALAIYSIIILMRDETIHLFRKV
jgi:hypothetical protein